MWDNKEEYKETANNLANLFLENMKKYENHENYEIISKM